MRDIKFRQPLFYKEKFNMWFYWGFTKGKEHGFTGPQNHQSKNYQYTGLHDKNGKEIYEGDILRLDEEFSSFEIYSITSMENDFKNHSDEYEIIGNIYENPELLKEREDGNRI